MGFKWLRRGGRVVKICIGNAAASIIEQKTADRLICMEIIRQCVELFQLPVLLFYMLYMLWEKKVNKQGPKCELFRFGWRLRYSH